MKRNPHLGKRFGIDMNPGRTSLAVVFVLCAVGLAGCTSDPAHENGITPPSSTTCNNAGTCIAVQSASFTAKKTSCGNTLSVSGVTCHRFSVNVDNRNGQSDFALRSGPWTGVDANGGGFDGAATRDAGPDSVVQGGQAQITVEVSGATTQIVTLWYHRGAADAMQSSVPSYSVANPAPSTSTTTSRPPTTSSSSSTTTPPPPPPAPPEKLNVTSAKIEPDACAFHGPCHTLTVHLDNRNGTGTIYNRYYFWTAKTSTGATMSNPGVYGPDQIAKGAEADFTLRFEAKDTSVRLVQLNYANSAQKFGAPVPAYST